MEDGDSRKGTVNPAELWMDWYETSTKMWSEAMKSAPEGQADPWGLYRQWIEGMEEARKSIAGGSAQVPDAAKSAKAMMSPMGNMGGFGGAMDPEQMREVAQQMTKAWQKKLKLGMDMMSAAPRWMEMMEQTRRSLTEGVDADAIMDPLQLVTQTYNATSGPLSEYVKDMIEQEEFLEPSSRLLQNYARFYKVFSRASEQYLNTLQFPTRSDVTRVASLVVALEDKVDRIEEAFEDFEDGSADFATNEAVESLQERMSNFEEKLDRLLSAADSSEATNKTNADANEERIGRVEEKLDRISTAMEQPADTSATDELGGRMDQVESKLDQLIAILKQPSDTSATDNLDERVDQVEGKHDQLLTSLGDLGPDTTELDTPSDTSASEANGRAADNAEVKATEAARRKARELGVDLAEVEGTGTGGQITVEDVRKKGAS